MNTAPPPPSIVYRWARWSEGHAFAITPEQIGFVEGLRAAAAIAAMLAGDLLLGCPDLSWSAFAAFWTCLCDPGGPDRLRLRTMGGFALAGAFISVIMAIGAMAGTVAGGLALLVVVFLCGLTRTYHPAYGPTAAQAGMVASIVAVVAVSFPSSPADALKLGAFFLLGSLWALLLCIGLWRTHPRAPARRAVAAVFARLDDMAVELLRLNGRATNAASRWSDYNIEHRRAVRIAIERGRETVAKLAAGRRHFSQAIDTADQMFASLIAIGHYLGARALPFDAESDRTLIEQLRALITEVIDQVNKLTPRTDNLTTLVNHLVREASRREGVVAHCVAVSAAAVTNLANEWSLPEKPDRRIGAVATDRWKGVPAPVLRHAGRVAVAVIISYTIAAQLNLTFSYWATMATVVVMQPLATSTWPRSVERMIGSIWGGLLAALLVAHLSDPFELAAVIVPLAAATIALRLVNYTLYVLFLTPLFVLVTDLVHPQLGIASARAINNIIGSLVGVAGSYLLWPDSKRDPLGDAVKSALAANIGLVVQVLKNPGVTTGDTERALRDAGIASGVAETVRQRMLLEGRRRSGRLDEIGRILVALRALSGAATERWITSGLRERAEDAARAQQYLALASALKDRFGQPSADVTLSVANEPEDDLTTATRRLVAAVQDFAAAARAPSV
jgi:uncharacterized membrane protein YccC